MNGSALLDTRSVLIVAVVMVVLMGLVSLVFAKVGRGMRALGLWCWGLLTDMERDPALPSLSPAQQ